MKKLTVFFSFLICVFYTNAQIVPDYGLYNQNLILINPANTASNGGLTANLGHKIQWMGFKGAPKNTYFGIEGLMTDAIGLGLVVNKYQMGLLDMTNINFNYSYRVNLEKKKSLAFGLNLNLLQNKISTESLSDYELADVALVSNNFDESSITSAAGIAYQAEDFCFGVSSPLLYSYQEHKFSQVLFTYFLYDFYLANDYWKIQPSALLKYNISGPFQVDFNFLAEWKKNTWGQVSVSSNTDFLMGIGVFIKYLGLGYAYEMNRRPISYLSSGSHEIVIKFRTEDSMKRKALFREGRIRNFWR